MFIYIYIYSAHTQYRWMNANICVPFVCAQMHFVCVCILCRVILIILTQCPILGEKEGREEAKGEKRVREAGRGERGWSATMASFR